MQEGEGGMKRGWKWFSTQDAMGLPAGTFVTRSLRTINRYQVSVIAQFPARLE